MCNLYSVTKGQQAIREAAAAMHDLTVKRRSKLTLDWRPKLALTQIR
jgi:hypothetical protein